MPHSFRDEPAKADLAGVPNPTESSEAAYATGTSAVVQGKVTLLAHARTYSGTNFLPGTVWYHFANAWQRPTLGCGCGARPVSSQGPGWAV
jgi:hypothetical protein